MRIVAMKFGICRSGREGGSPGSVIFGNGKLREQRGATSFRGGIVSLPENSRTSHNSSNEINDLGLD